MLAAADSILAREDGPISIRHLFYRLVGLRVIEKSETEYKNLCAQLAKWRRGGLIQWDAFVDSTRWHIGSRLYSSLDDALERTVETYRRDLWENQGHYVECWVEKDAIAGIISGTADSFGVKTFVCRGFPSLSSLFSAGNTFKQHRDDGRELSVIYFGDHDPSGLAIDRRAREILGNDFGVDVNFTRVAVTPLQIVEMGLPTRPVKVSDSRAKGWEGGCVEIDTIRSADLKQMVESEIVERIDRGEWVKLQQIEAAERETLRAAQAYVRKAA